MKRKHTKNTRAILLVVAVFVVLSLSVSASSGTVTKELNYADIKIQLDGQELIPMDTNGNYVEPFIIDGTTYLPVRGIASALRLDVGWDGATKTVFLTTPERERDIYITKTGKHYHYDPQCNGGTYWAVPYETAIGFGLTPCDKCVLTAENGY